MIEAKQVVDEARRWVGVPFRHIGRDASGIDCVGLPIVVCRALSLLPPEFDSGVYGRLPTGQLADRLGEHCVELPRAVPGSIIVIRWLVNAAHVGICTGPNMIHAYEALGKVIEHGYRGRWVRITHSVWGLPGVRYE